MEERGRDIGKIGMGKVDQCKGGISQNENGKEMCNLQTQGEWETVKVTIDSGAAYNVMPEGMLPYLKTEDGRKKGVEYIVANGNPIPNKGERRVHTVTEQGQFINFLIQVTDVNKILISVGQRCEAGYTLQVRREGGDLIDGKGNTLLFQKRERSI